MTISDAQKEIRGAYGRGFHDGIKSVGDTELNNARMKQTIDGLSAQARRVYDATPASEAWTPGQICGELARMGLAHDAKVVLGCLMSLVHSGVVREVKAGMFSRVSAKPVVVKVPPLEKEPNMRAPDAKPAAVPESASDTLTKIASIGSQIRGAAEDLIALANGLDDVAIEVEERISKIDADTATLRQLQALLKNIGVGAS